MLAVVEKLLWPSHSWISFMDTPFFNSRLAQVCPYGIINMFNIGVLYNAADSR